MVSEFMLQQTQVVTVLGYFDRWLARFPDFTTLAAASEDEILHAWQGLGYYSRARNLHHAARQIVAEHGGKLPDDPAIIASLPGVGRYTAGAIAAFAFDLPIPAVDANIARVLARLTDLREPIDSTAGSARLWQNATDLLPENHAREHTSALMELGALICLPRKPRCEICPIRAGCKTPDPESLPIKKPRAKTIALEENCAWIVSRDRILLEQQTGPRWRGMWKLAAVTSPTESLPILQLDYPFTNHRITLRVFVQPHPLSIGENQRWQPIPRLSALALTSPHRRAVERILGDANTQI